MNIVYIAGGKYKSFYLNCFLKLGKCDLLIFNYGIIYDYNINNKQSINIIKQEIKELAKSLNCTVLAGVNLISKHTKDKSLLLFWKDNIILEKLNKGVDFSVENFDFIAGGTKADYSNKHKIVFSKNKLKVNLQNCNRHKIYLFCDDFGVSVIRHKKLKRKFNKCSKIILK